MAVIGGEMFHVKHFSPDHFFCRQRGVECLPDPGVKPLGLPRPAGRGQGRRPWTLLCGQIRPLALRARGAGDSALCGARPRALPLDPARDSPSLDPARDSPSLDPAAALRARIRQKVLSKGELCVTGRQFSANINYENAFVPSDSVLLPENVTKFELFPIYILQKHVSLVIIAAGQFKSLL